MQVAKRLFELAQGSIFGTTSVELTPSDQDNDVQVRDVWAGLSLLVEKLAHGKSMLRETVKKSQDTQLRAEREAQTARSEVKRAEGKPPFERAVVSRSRPACSRQERYCILATS